MIKIYVLLKFLLKNEFHYFCKVFENPRTLDGHIDFL